MYGFERLPQSVSPQASGSRWTRPMLEVETGRRMSHIQRAPQALPASGMAVVFPVTLV